MSIAIAITCSEGVAVSSDSRVCLSPAPDVSEGLLPFSDAGRKLSIFHGRYIVVWGGGARAASTSEALQGLHEDPRIMAAGPEDFIPALGNALRRHPDALVLVAWAGPTGPRVGQASSGRFDFFQCRDPRGTVLPYGPHAVFHPEVADRLLGEARIPYGALGLEDAANLSRFVVQATIDLCGFELRERLVGGPVVTAIATLAEGARILHERTFTLRDFG